MRCEECHDAMVDVLYEDLDADARARFDAHVDGCAGCASRLSEARSTLELMGRCDRPDPGAAYWDGYWDRLRLRMESEGVEFTGSERPWWLRNLLEGAPRRASWAVRAAAAAAILVLGVFVGRTFFPAPNSVSNSSRVATTAPAGDVGRERGDAAQLRSRGGGAVPAAANERALRYVEKSKLLLIALVNADPSSPESYAAGLEDQRRRSRQLVDEADAVRAELDDPKERRLRALVGELEKILVQIANLESDDDLDAVEFIRSSVDEHDVLFRINLEQMRLGNISDGDANRAAPEADLKGNI